MRARRLFLLCLLFSGLSALVYQVVWTRLLGFAFGTTTEAIGSVLAVFFGGMALGNWIAARSLARVARPLRVYAMLELFIGLFALVSLPGLRHLDALHGWIGGDASPTAITAARLVAAIAILLPPTVAMGATLPVVAHGLVDRDEWLGRWSSYIYSANTLGAVLGAYLCGFWMIPALGLTHTVLVAAAVNLGVAGAVWLGAGRLAPLAASAAAATPDDDGPGTGQRGWYLAFFGVSGFVAIGYEIIWSKVFTIVMEGTLYGFSTVLSAYLMGVALGSLAISGRVDRIRDLPRAFGLLHVAIAVCVALGISLVGDLPYWYQRLSPPDGGGIHRLYLVAAPIVLLPTALFGAAFPVLIRLYTARARHVGRGVGMATAVNTAGSIAASLGVSFVLIDRIGMDATLYLLLVLELAVGVAVLLRFQSHEGWARMKTALPGLAMAALVASAYNGVHVEQAVTGRWIDDADFSGYRAELERRSAHTALVIEGKTSVVTVHTSPEGWSLQNDGMPEAAFRYAPPYRALESLLLGVLPYLTAERPERALVVGFGGGSTLDALMRTDLDEIDVVELEKGVVDAIPVLYQGRPSPLDDPRVRIRLDDGRNELLRGRYSERPRYDVIASQPSHPWLVGAANLFTREYFELARDNLSPGGVFSVWVNGFHIDRDALLSIVKSFDAVFPGSVLVSAGEEDPYSSFILLGGLRPLRWDVERVRERMAEPALREELALQDVQTSEDLLTRFEGPASAFAASWTGPANDDDNAYVETRLSRVRSWEPVDFSEIEKSLEPGTPVLPGVDDALALAVAHAMLPRLDRAALRPYGRKLQRLVANRIRAAEPFEAELLQAEVRAFALPGRDADVPLEEVARAHPDRPEPLRALARHAAARHDGAAAGAAFGEAWRRSHRDGDAASAARFLLVNDEKAALAWLERVPADRRDDLPELAPARAARALALGESSERLEARYEDLLAWRDTRRGRVEPGTSRLLADLAEALGRRRDALLWSDLDLREREGRGLRLLSQAARSHAAGDAKAAAALLDGAERLLPGDRRVAQLALRVAASQGDLAEVSRRLATLRRGAPSLAAAIAEENRLRAELGIPLLPQQPPEALIDALGGARLAGDDDAGGAAPEARGGLTAGPGRG